MRERIPCLAVALLLGLLAPEAQAQLCANTAPLATDTSLASVQALFESPDATRITAASGSTLYFLNPTTLGDFDAVLMTGDVADGAADYASTAGPSTSADVFVGETNGYIEAIDSGAQVTWRRNLARSGCGNDGLTADPPEHHWRPEATPGFQGTYAGDLVCVATNYAPDGSGGCTGDHRTDNKVYALDAADGSIAWTFNGSGTEDVAAVYGMVLDASVDRLYVATVAGEIKALDPATGSEHYCGMRASTRR